MNHMNGLVVFSKVIVKLLNWLADNLVRIFESMREQCPNDADETLVGRIMDAAFGLAF